jgi:hypothetical protein
MLEKFSKVREKEAGMAGYDIKFIMFKLFVPTSDSLFFRLIIIIEKGGIKMFWNGVWN